jgi:murein DD-endopeptidase MepM/ murein hydrolase activator NlpD
VPRSRHIGLALFALPIAISLALSPRASDGPAAPVGVTDAAAALPDPAPERRSEPYAPKPDPDGSRGETGLAGPPSVAALTGYVWPLPRARLTLGFEHSRWGSRIVDGELFHDGIDLATFCGDRIYAAHDGVVLAAGRRYDQAMGWQGDLQPYFDRLDEKQAWLSLPIVLVIDDGNGYRSLYAHFSKIVVRRGDVVEAGQLIGYEGRTGRASGCHLHYGLFSPLETKTFRIAPAVAEKLLLPSYQTARVNPLDVLPQPVEIDETQDGERPTARPRTTVPAAPVQTALPGE